MKEPKMTIASARRERFARYALAAATFVGMLVFFTRLNPLYIFDTDDWLYIHHQRAALPLWGIWNPTRVLPECLMPFCGKLAAHVVFPVVGDYFESIMLVVAAAVSLSISLYQASFSRMLAYRFRMSIAGVICVSIVFLLLHFLPYVGTVRQGDHLLYPKSVTTYFYYTIPSLLCRSLVMAHITDGWKALEDGGLKRAGLVCAVYFALLSNLYSSVILGAYFSSTLLVDAWRWARSGRGAVSPHLFLRRHATHIVIVSLWVLVQLFEANGQRASYASDTPLLVGFCQSLANTARAVLGMNKAYLLLCTCLAIFGLWCMSRDGAAAAVAGAGGESLAPALLASTLLTVVYVCLVNSRVNVSYSLRSDVNLGICLLPLVVVGVGCGAIYRKVSFADAIFPLAAAVLVSLVGFAFGRFDFSNVAHLPPGTVKAIDEDIYRQVCSAASSDDADGVARVYVPRWDTADNWPLAVYGGSRFSSALYAHGIIDRKIKVELVPSLEKNDEFAVDANGKIAI